MGPFTLTQDFSGRPQPAQKMEEQCVSEETGIYWFFRVSWQQLLYKGAF